METRDVLKTWLNDAYAMENALVPILENHAKDAENYSEIRDRDQQHADETRRHAQLVEGCLERMGESPSATKSAAGSLFGSMQSVTTGPFRDELVKNFLTDYATEHFEIAAYKSLIAAAREAGDEETAQVCESILQEEEQMAAWLEDRLPAAVRETIRENMA